MSTKKNEATDAKEPVAADAVEQSAPESIEAPAFDRREDATTNKLKRAIFSVPIEVVVSVGAARPLIGELLAMERDHLLPLDSTLEDPVELRVNNRVIARGQLTKMEDGRSRLGVRLTEIVDMSDIA
ncbi:MAG: FliM/FliN family flagellar motor switch protein [Amphiplicatus sp.]